jgi:TraG P-loop domain
MFDGPTSRGLNLNGRLVVFNLREVKDAARPILMACTAAWLQGAWARNDGVRRIVVLDEAWVILRHLAIARWLRESWKLARAYGVQNIAVMHRLSDLTAAGDEGSEQVQLAKGLLEDSETRVIYRQSFGEVERARELLGLSQIEADQIPNLQRGEALWRVGQRSFIVQHRLSPLFERELIDTDANMATRLPQSLPPEGPAGPSTGDFQAVPGPAAGAEAPGGFHPPGRAAFGEVVPHPSPAARPVDGRASQQRAEDARPRE